MRILTVADAGSFLKIALNLGQLQRLAGRSMGRATKMNVPQGIYERGVVDRAARMEAHRMAKVDPGFIAREKATHDALQQPFLPPNAGPGAQRIEPQMTPFQDPRKRVDAVSAWRQNNPGGGAAQTPRLGNNVLPQITAPSASRSAQTVVARPMPNTAPSARPPMAPAGFDSDSTGAFNILPR